MDMLSALPREGETANDLLARLFREKEEARLAAEREQKRKAAAERGPPLFQRDLERTARKEKELAAMRAELESKKLEGCTFRPSIIRRVGAPEPPAKKVRALGQTVCAFPLPSPTTLTRPPHTCAQPGSSDVLGTASSAAKTRPALPARSVTVSPARPRAAAPGSVGRSPSAAGTPTGGAPPSSGRDGSPRPAGRGPREYDASAGFEGYALDSSGFEEGGAGGGARSRVAPSGSGLAGSTVSAAATPGLVFTRKAGGKARKGVLVGPEGEEAGGRALAVSQLDTESPVRGTAPPLVGVDSLVSPIGRLLGPGIAPSDVRIVAALVGALLPGTAAGGVEEAGGAPPPPPGPPPAEAGRMLLLAPLPPEGEPPADAMRITSEMLIGSPTGQAPADGEPSPPLDDAAGDGIVSARDSEASSGGPIASELEAEALRREMEVLRRELAAERAAAAKTQAEEEAQAAYAERGWETARALAAEAAAEAELRAAAHHQKETSRRLSVSKEEAARPHPSEQLLANALLEVESSRKEAESSRKEVEDLQAALEAEKGSAIASREQLASAQVAHAAEVWTLRMRPVSAAAHAAAAAGLSEVVSPRKAGVSRRLVDVEQWAASPPPQPLFSGADEADAGIDPLMEYADILDALAAETASLRTKLAAETAANAELRRGAADDAARAEAGLLSLQAQLVAEQKERAAAEASKAAVDAALAASESGRAAAERGRIAAEAAAAAAVAEVANIQAGKKSTLVAKLEAAQASVEEQRAALAVRAAPSRQRCATLSHTFSLPPQAERATLVAQLQADNSDLAAIVKGELPPRLASSPSPAHSFLPSALRRGPGVQGRAARRDVRPRVRAHELGR
jgi:hypothetical protein